MDSLFANNEPDLPIRFMTCFVSVFLKMMRIRTLFKKIKNVDEICQNIIEKLVENRHNEYHMAYTVLTYQSYKDVDFDKEFLDCKKMIF